MIDGISVCAPIRIPRWDSDVFMTMLCLRTRVVVVVVVHIPTGVDGFGFSEHCSNLLITRKGGNLVSQLGSLPTARLTNAKPRVSGGSEVYERRCKLSTVFRLMSRHFDGDFASHCWLWWFFDDDCAVSCGSVHLFPKVLLV